MVRTLFFLLWMTPLILSGQINRDSTEFSKYLEDQFYVGITYNFLLNKPEGITQRNLSYGLQGGFIKDIPINRARTVAFGIGLGYGVNSYYSNLLATEVGDSFEYRPTVNADSLKRNKIETHLIEMPIQIRWRNSTSSSYKFWRLYTGVKLGYIVGSRSKFVSENSKNSFYNTDTRNFRYGLTMDLGYNTFNIHAYYGLNKLFEDNTVTNDGESIDSFPLRIGLIFYIL